MHIAVALIAPQGGGKTTQILALKQNGYNPVTMSKGLDWAQANLPEFHDVAACRDRGELVPFGKTVRALESFLEHEQLLGKQIVFDGFPRSVDQAAWLKLWAERNEYCLRYVLLDNLDIDRCLERIDRRIKDMIDHGDVPRADDLDPIARRRRLQIYFENLPTLRKFMESTELLITVDGSLSPTEVTAPMVRQITQVECLIAAPTASASSRKEQSSEKSFFAHKTSAS